MSITKSTVLNRRQLLMMGSLGSAINQLSGQTSSPGSPEPEVVNVSSHWQMFIDDHIIRSSRGMLRSVNYPSRLAKNPIFTRQEPWEGYAVGIPEVLRRADGTYEMLYASYSLEEGPRTCYATSRDGLEWERPSLGLFEYKGSKRNNIVMVPEGTKDAMLHTVIVDPDDPDSTRRYKMLYFDHFKGDRAIALGAAFSPDAIHWTKHAGNPVYTDTGDTGSVLNVKVNGKFVYFHKPKLPVRSIRRIESADFVNWSGETLALYPDQYDPSDCEFYGMSTFLYENVYIGLIWVYSTYPDTLDLQLAFSRDSVKWERAAARRIYMPRGRSPEAWDRYQIYPAPFPIVHQDAEGTELRLYFEGWNGPHNQPIRQSGLGLATIRREGFVFLDAIGSDASMETRGLRYKGRELLLSADIRPDGECRVSIPGTGITSERLEPFDRRKETHRVVWPEGKSLPPGDKPVSFRIDMRRARLFAIRFQ